MRTLFILAFTSVVSASCGTASLSATVTPTLGATALPALPAVFVPADDQPRYRPQRGLQRLPLPATTRPAMARPAAGVARS